MTGDPLEDRQCTATSKRSRERCKRAAILGGTVCAMHGGKSPAVRAAAGQRLVEQQARRVMGAVWDPDAAPITDPVGALQQLSGRLERAADVLGSMLGGDQEPCDACGHADVDLDSPPAVAWARVLKELRQSLEGMARLGIEERQIQLEQQRAEVIVSAFRAALEVIQLVPADRDLLVATFLDRLAPVIPGEVAAS